MMIPKMIIESKPGFRKEGQTRQEQSHEFSDSQLNVPATQTYGQS